MDFEEAFERYKAGTAAEDEKALVERELEKNRLISEYLADDYEADYTAGESPASELKNVRKSIRKRSRNIIIVTLAVAAALALVFNFAGVPLLNSLYYNPMTHEYSPYSYDIDVSLSAYTELFFAGYYHSGTVIKRAGIGRYDMTIIRSDMTTGESDFLAAVLDKNILSAPYALTAGLLPVNVFARASYPFYNLDPEREKMYDKELAELPGYITVTADVSFSEDLTMGQLLDLMRGRAVNFLWAGIRNTPEDAQLFPLCGMDLTGAGPVYENVSDTYPSFELNMSPGKDALSAEDYENHFTSLLRFMIDHTRFLEALKTERDYESYCRYVLDYVTKNGVKTYGVMVIGSAADILALKDSGVVSQIRPIKADIHLG